MKHVTAIKKMLDDGEIRQAESALESLLELGPSNLEALKLKGQIYSAEGRFRDEEAVWLQILRIDGEDTDAIDFVQKRHLEDREHYYFTDDLPGGGRRFLAYPRTLVNISVVGLTGCLGFLMLTRLSEQFTFLQNPMVVFICFLTLVVSPWVGIVAAFCRSIRAVDVSQAGVGFATRLQSYKFGWPDVEKICLAYSDDLQNPQLRLVVIPKDPLSRPVEIDMNEDSSPIRARTHLVNEIAIHYGPVHHEPRLSLASSPRKPVIFQ